MNTTATSPLTVTTTTFARDVLAASHETPVLVDFWAAWCGPCRMMAPALDEIAAERAGSLTIAKVDVDEHPELASQYNIRALPTLLLFRNGAPVQTLVGLRAKHELLHAIDSAPAAAA